MLELSPGGDGGPRRRWGPQKVLEQRGNCMATLKRAEGQPWWFDWVGTG